MDAIKVVGVHSEVGLVLHRSLTIGEHEFGTNWRVLHFSEGRVREEQACFRNVAFRVVCRDLGKIISCNRKGVGEEVGQALEV